MRRDISPLSNTVALAVGSINVDSRSRRFYLLCTFSLSPFFPTESSAT